MGKFLEAAAGSGARKAAKEVTCEQEQLISGQLALHGKMISDIRKNLKGMPRDVRMEAMKIAATFHPAAQHLEP